MSVSIIATNPHEVGVTLTGVILDGQLAGTFRLFTARCHVLCVAGSEEL